jgi:hypothetical protein
MVLVIWPALFAGFHLLANRKEANNNLNDIDREI